MRKKEGPERCGVHHSSPCAQGEYLVLLLLALHDRGNPRNMPGEDNFEVFDPRSWPVRPFSAVTFSVCLRRSLSVPSRRQQALWEGNCILPGGEIQTTVLSLKE